MVSRIPIFRKDDGCLVGWICSILLMGFSFHKEGIDELLKSELTSQLAGYGVMGNNVQDRKSVV